MYVYNLIMYLPMYICSSTQMKEMDPGAGWSESPCAPRHNGPSRSGSRIKPSLSLSATSAGHPLASSTVPPWILCWSTPQALRFNCKHATEAYILHTNSLSLPPPRQATTSLNPTPFCPSHTPHGLRSLPHPVTFPILHLLQRLKTRFTTARGSSRPPSRSPHVVICGDITPTIPVC
jgi:hypothetical protein